MVRPSCSIAIVAAWAIRSASPSSSPSTWEGTLDLARMWYFFVYDARFDKSAAEVNANIHSIS